MKIERTINEFNIFNQLKIETNQELTRNTHLNHEEKKENESYVLKTENIKNKNNNFFQKEDSIIEYNPHSKEPNEKYEEENNKESKSNDILQRCETLDLRSSLTLRRRFFLLDTNMDVNEEDVNENNKKIEEGQEYDEIHFNEEIYQIPQAISSQFILNSEMTKMIGKGSFGIVFRLQRSSDKSLVAVKLMTFSNAAAFNNIIKEINILYRLMKYGNIVQFIENYNDLQNQTIFMIMENADMSLKKYLQQNKNGLDKDTFDQLFIDMVYALSYSYHESVVHSDIKPANILVFTKESRKKLLNLDKSEKFDQLIFKLTDFGAGTIRMNSDNETKWSKEMTYTSNYASPEYFLAEKNPAVLINFEKADIYSLGMSLLFAGGLKKSDIHHFNKNQDEKIHDKEMEEVISKLSEKYPSKIEILEGMLKFDKNSRFNLNMLRKKLDIILPFDSPKKRREKKLSSLGAHLPLSMIAGKTSYDFKPEIEKIKNAEQKLNVLYDIIKKNRKCNDLSILDNFDDIILEVETAYDSVNNSQENKDAAYILKYEQNQEIYLGKFKEGCRTGIGIQVWPDGKIYCGNFRRNFISDRGLMIFQDGRVFHGFWRNGMMECGKLLDPNKNLYYGNFISELQDGEALELSPDGTVYNGGFSEGKRHGKGILRTHDDKTKNVWYHRGQLIKEELGDKNYKILQEYKINYEEFSSPLFRSKKNQKKVWNLI